MKEKITADKLFTELKKVYVERVVRSGFEDSRVFHQETGKKLVDYLQEVRMEHAARLIRENELTNEEICEAIGYSRLQYFSSKFKEYYGVSLNEYRRRYCEGQDAPQEDAIK